MRKTAQETGELHPSCSGKRGKPKAAHHLYKKKKRERQKKGKMNPLHQAVGYTDSWQCSKLLCRIFKNNNKKKNPKWNKQKLKTFRKTSRFQV